MDERRRCYSLQCIGRERRGAAKQRNCRDVHGDAVAKRSMDEQRKGVERRSTAMEQLGAVTRQRRSAQIGKERMYQEMTNADRIRQMTDEELAEWIAKHDCKTNLYGHWPKDAILDWLKQEVK